METLLMCPLATNQTILVPNQIQKIIVEGISTFVPVLFKYEFFSLSGIWYDKGNLSPLGHMKTCGGTTSTMEPRFPLGVGVYDSHVGAHFVTSYVTFTKSVL